MVARYDPKAPIVNGAAARRPLTLRQLMALIALVALAAGCWVNPLVMLVTMIVIHVLFPIHSLWMLLVPNYPRRGGWEDRVALANGAVALVGWVLYWVMTVQPFWIFRTGLFMSFVALVWIEMAAVVVLTLGWAVMQIRQNF